MERFSKLVIRFRALVLSLIVVISIGLGMWLPTIYADDDVMQFLPQKDPDVELFRRVNQRFGGLDVAIVGIESDSMFTAATLEKIRTLTKKIGQVDGVFDVLSFTEVPDPQPSAEGLRVEPLVMDKVPTEAAELQALKKRVLSNENAVGNMISADGKAAMILCFLGGDRPPIHIATDIKDAAAGIWTGNPIYFGGSPFIRLHIAGGTKKDIARLTPIVAVVVLLVTFLIFRKPIGVLLALGTVGVGLVWLMGIVALRGKGLTLVGSSLPTIGIAIGGAYGIHILAAYFAGDAPTVRDRIIQAMKNVGAPVIASAATTCAGFMSFLVMDIAPLREFGVYAAAGVAFTALLAITAIPAILSFSKHVPSKLGSSLMAKPLGKLGHWAERHRSWALSIAVIMAVAGVFGVLRIAPDPTLETFFKKGSEPDEANRFLERNFGGSVYLQVYFEGDMRSPFVLAQLRKIVEFAKGMDEIVQVNSIIDPLTMLSEAMGGRADLPVNNRRTGYLYPFLDGTAAINQLVAPEKDACLVQIRLRDIGPQQVDAAVKNLRAFIENEVPRGIMPVQMASFLDPQDRNEFVTLEKVNGDGEVVRPSELIDIAVINGPREAKLRRAQLLREVAQRVVRIARIHGGPQITDEAARKVLEVLEGEDAKGDIEAGPDLDKAIADLVAEHVGGDAPVFEDPLDGASDEELAEWKSREDLMTAALKIFSGKKTDLATMKGLIERTLSLTSARDPEGLTLTAQAMVAGLSQAQAAIRARRLSGPALAAAGVDSPSADLNERVAWAITDIDLTVYGFPETGKNATTVLARVTGQPVINMAFCNSTIRNQLRSLALALIVLALIMSIFFRSVISAVKGLTPAVFMLAVAVGVMGAAKIPLDLTTSMIAAIALGIGVDYSIHFLWRRRRRGESLGKTTAQVGPSIAANAIQVAAGFAVLSLSDMIPMQRFGLLVAMTMLLSATATFVLLPAIRAQGSEAPATEQEDEDTSIVPT